MSNKETLYVTLNAGVLAIGYTLIGVLVSYVLYYLFDVYDEDWKKRSVLFQITDVSLEIALLSIIAFWSAHVIEIAPPFFPVRKRLDLLVDGYISGIFYVFAVFVFMDDLTEKLKYLFDLLLSSHFSKLFPQYGSILDLSLSYTPRKTDKEKEVDKMHQHGV